MTELRPETIALHAGQTPDPTTKARAVPIYQTTSFVFDDTQHAADLFALAVPGNIYTRIMNPTWDVFEQRVTALEGGLAAVATASGQAAVTYSVLNVDAAGDNIIAISTLYGGTYNLFAHTLPQYGIEVRWADPDDPDAGRPARRRQDAAGLRRDDREPEAERRRHPRVGRRRARRGPAADRRQHRPDADPLPRLRPRRRRLGSLGDEVHRRPRHVDRRHRRRLGPLRLDGAGGALPGLTKPDPSYHGVVWADVLGPAAYIGRVRTVLLRNTGAALSPFNAFLFLQGLETLPLRMERHSQNALAVAEHLEGQDGVTWVNYPGLESSPSHEVANRILKDGYGGLVTFGIEGGRDAGRKFIESLELFSHLANIGDAKSLAIHNASTTHSQLNEEELASAGVTQDTVRLSVGIEHLDDILGDLNQALAKAAVPVAV